MRIKVLMLANMNTRLFWYMMPCSPVDRYQCFIGTYGSLLQKNKALVPPKCNIPHQMAHLNH